jgi:serine/threonine-protein kinase
MAFESIGKYRLIAELGQGGTARVFLAVVTGPAGLGFSKLVVIKRLKADVEADPEFVAMLIDEARLAARLNHPNVVQTIEIGEDRGQYFLAMEYLDGQSLRTVLKRAQGSSEAGFPANLHYAVLERVLAGLHYAHELTDYDRTPLEVVHRDVTPHNVFLTYEGQVKIVDFGIAKAIGRRTQTRIGFVKGKAWYMAPEQASDRAVDRRADIFAVGVMLWEAAVGTRVWGDLTYQDILARLRAGEVPSSPRKAKKTVPKPLDAICRRALAIDPDERYATAEEFGTALSEYLDKLGRPTERELGGYVSTLFKGTRERARAVIEEQLARMNTAPPPR